LIFSLEDAPKFFITMVQRDNNYIKYFGKIDKEFPIKTDWIAYLIDGSKFIAGTFTEVNSENFSATFQTEDKINLLTENKQYPALDCYWGDRARLVLDEKRKWQKIYFKSTDADKFKLNGAIGLQQVGNELPDGAERIGLVKEGWDHEHCYICWQTISETEVNNEFGFVDENNNWVCQECYSEFIEKKSLGFINY